jgi:hypothetical protein
MGQQHGVLGGLRCLAAVERLEMRMLERHVQRSQAVGALGVALGRDVFQEDRMFVKAGAHAITLSACLGMIHSRWGRAR